MQRGLFVHSFYLSNNMGNNALHIKLLNQQRRENGVFRESQF